MIKRGIHRVIFEWFFPKMELKTGDWLIYKDDVEIDFSLCTTSLKYNQVVKLLEIKHVDGILIVDIGLRYKDTNTFSINTKTGCYIPGQGIRWLKMERFRVATDEEVDFWLSENDLEYHRDRQLNKILKK